MIAPVDRLDDEPLEISTAVGQTSITYKEFLKGVDVVEVAPPQRIA